MTNTQHTPMQSRPAGLIRRLMAMLYDTIAVFTLVYFATFIPLVASGGEALQPRNWLLTIYLLAVIYAYFAVCWSRGRTLGMQAWKIRIVDEHGTFPALNSILRRFCMAFLSLGCAGLGYWLSLVDRERRTWHDRFSGTRLIDIRDQGHDLGHGPDPKLD